MPASDLSAFLRAARAKIDPASVPIAHGGNRRVSGLRREDVAELADMSETWYARFEAGRARLSLPALGRIADVLRLERGERSRLFTLARPEIAADQARHVHFDYGGLSELRVVQRLLRRLRDVSTVDDVAVLALQALNGCARPTSLAYWVDQIDDDGNACFTHTAGPAGDAYIGLWQPAQSCAHER